MCFYAYKNVLEPMGHLGANLIFSILTLNQVTFSDLLPQSNTEKFLASRRSFEMSCSQNAQYTASTQLSAPKRQDAKRCPW